MTRELRLSARNRPWVVSIGPLHTRIPLRRISLAAVLLGLALALGVLSLTVGDIASGFSAVLRVLNNQGSPIERVVIVQWRLPRAVLGLLVGASLGFAGALCQTVTRNPLATPDILGVSAGAAAGAVVSVVSRATGATWAPPVPVASLIGALVATAIIGVAVARCGLDPLRVVLVGVAVSFGLGAVTDYLLVTAPAGSAMEAQTWLAGSLEAASWDRVLPVAGALILVVIGGVILSGQLSSLDFDSVTARGIGVPLTPVRIGALALAVLATAAAVSASGPVPFVAFAAPLIARALAKSSAALPIVSACSGALLVITADLIARTILPWSVPVGLVTAGIGAPLLVATIIKKTSQR